MHINQDSVVFLRFFFYEDQALMCRCAHTRPEMENMGLKLPVAFTNGEKGRKITVI